MLRNPINMRAVERNTVNLLREQGVKIRSISDGIDPETAEAAEVRRVLVRLSGRQMRWGREYTEPALLAGLWVLLSVIRVLEYYDLKDRLRWAESVLPTHDPPEIPLKSAV